MEGRNEIDNKTESKCEEILRELPDFISGWNIRMKNSGKTASTRYNYIRKARRFMKYINDDPRKVEIKDITSKNVEGFYSTIPNSNKEYKNTIWSFLHKFLEYMRSERMIEENYIERTDRLSTQLKSNFYNEETRLTENDFNKILKSVNTGIRRQRRTGTGISSKKRDYAIFILFMMTGMRRTALTSINIEDLDFEKKKIPVIDKREKQHVYEMEEITENAITDWLKEREYFASNVTTNALFVNKYGDRLSSDAVYDIVEKYCDNALGRHISPHKIRAGFCTILYERTKNIQFVCEAVGHNSPQTTKRYINIEDEAKKEAGSIMSSVIAS